MQIPIVALIAGGGALVGLFVAAFLAARAERNRRADLVLAGLMVLFSLSIMISPGSRPNLGRFGASTQISPIPARTSPTITSVQPKLPFPPAPFIYGFLPDTSAP